MSKKLLVVGGAGALGRGVVSRFALASWGITSVGFSANEDADNNVLLPDGNSLKQAEQTLQELSSRCNFRSLHLAYFTVIVTYRYLLCVQQIRQGEHSGVHRWRLGWREHPRRRLARQSGENARQEPRVSVPG
jgi:NAD(P)-dependent dehydrogenase (short-subunit alcohol dehydrogenase family)